MANRTPLTRFSLANEGNRLAIAFGGSESMVTVVEHVDDRVRGRGIRVLYADQSSGLLFDGEMSDGERVEVVH